MILRLNRTKYISLDYERAILERFQTECGIEFMENSFDIVQQYQKGQELQLEFKMEEKGSGIDFDFIAVSSTAWPFVLGKPFETEIEPVRAV